MNIFTDINWLAVVIGWFVSYALGAIWFSPLMFLTPWQKGLGTMAVKNRSFVMLLGSQAVVSFIYALVLALTLPYSFVLTVIIALMVAGMVKSYGLYSGKTIAAVTVESTYIVVQAAIVIAILNLMQ